MLRKFLFLLPAILLIQVFCSGQTRKMETYQQDTAYISECADMCRKVIYFYPDSASTYIDSIASRSKKIDYEYGFYMVHTFRGSLYWFRGDMDMALDEFKRGLKYANNKQFPDRKAKVLGNIALAYTRQMEIDSAIMYLDQTIAYSKKHNIDRMYRKALFDLGNLHLGQDNYIETARNYQKVRKALETDMDSVLMMYLFSGYGTLYTHLNKFDSSLCYYNKSIALSHQLTTVDLLSTNYLNVGELYFRQKQEYDTAAHYYYKAIEHALPANIGAIRVKANINLGNVFLEKLQYDSARKYYEDVLNSPLIDRLPKAKTAATINIGVYNYKVGNFKEAQWYLDSGYAMARRLGVLSSQQTALKSLYRLDSINGNLALAFQHFKEYNFVTDSLLEFETNKEMAILEFEKYINQEKLNNAGLIQENMSMNRRMILLAVVIFILLILLYALALNTRKRKMLNKELSASHNQLEETNKLLSVQQAELQKLNASKDKLFSVLGHDLKSPFSGILGMLDLVNKNWGIMSETEKKEMLELLFISSERVSELLDNILNWGKTQQGLVNVDRKKVALYPVLKEIIGLFEVQIDAKKLQVEIVMSEKDLSLDTDSMLLSRVVQNLLSNAVKFTPKGGAIHIKVEELNQEIRLSVIDSGMGIPKDKVSTIFDVNLSYRRAGTEGEKSTGMGLLLSKEYTALLGASLHVSSVEGEGSSFTLTLLK